MKQDEFINELLEKEFLAEAKAKKKKKKKKESFRSPYLGWGPVYRPITTEEDDEAGEESESTPETEAVSSESTPTVDGGDAGGDGGGE